MQPARADLYLYPPLWTYVHLRYAILRRWWPGLAVQRSTLCNTVAHGRRCKTEFRRFCGAARQPEQACGWGGMAPTGMLPTPLLAEASFALPPGRCRKSPQNGLPLRQPLARAPMLHAKSMGGRPPLLQRLAQERVLRGNVAPNATVSSDFASTPGPTRPDRPDGAC
jgi:hypothetical protein